jgi:plasmid stabilization system protein ParE
VTRQVQWSREALDEFKGQITYIAAKNPAAARQVADRIREAGTALGVRPTGRPGRVSGTYEKSVARLPYIIAYAITSDAGQEFVSILHLIHTAQDWPAEQWPK